MKAIIGWLGDPFLHLLGIAVIVVVIGTRMSADSANDDSIVITRCEVCHKVHDLSKACRQVVSHEKLAVQR